MRLILLFAGVLATGSISAAYECYARSGASPGVRIESAPICEIDLDRDGRGDVAVEVPSDGAYNLVALLRTAKSYEAIVLFTSESLLELECRRGDSVVETTAARRLGTRHATGGSYIRLFQPEGASFAFFWTGKEFRQVQTSD